MKTEFRPLVYNLAEAMEYKLKRNDEQKRDSYKYISRDILIAGLTTELMEFLTALDNKSYQDTLLEAADVSNYLAMLCERVKLDGINNL